MAYDLSYWYCRGVNYAVEYISLTLNTRSNNNRNNLKFKQCLKRMQRECHGRMITGRTHKHTNSYQSAGFSSLWDEPRHYFNFETNLVPSTYLILKHGVPSCTRLITSVYARRSGDVRWESYSLFCIMWMGLLRAIASPCMSQGCTLLPAGEYQPRAL
jgi:hypothetical protein